MTVFMGFFVPVFMLYHRLNSDLEKLKMDHQKETSEVEKFPKEISEASSNCKELTEKTNSYR